MADHRNFAPALTNSKGEPFFALLRKAGLPVQGVVVLGCFVHVECCSDDVARKVLLLLAQAGIKPLKITQRTDRAADGLSWVTKHTAHGKA